ncbi:MAG: hypothetical protein NVS1B7_4960 [Candidatus Saccharimonadales bacterium]
MSTFTMTIHKKFISKHRQLFIVGCVLSLALLILSWQRIVMASQPTLNLPAAVVIDQATVVDQGVEIKWLESQPGDHPIAGYIIEVSHKSSPFTIAGHVEQGSLSFIDPLGEVGDGYRVIAEDDSSPANHSGPSEVILATVAKAGDTVAIDPHITEAAPELHHDAIAQSTPLPSPDQVTTDLQVATSQANTELDTAIESRNNDTAYSILETMQRAHGQALLLLPQLSFVQRAAVLDGCEQQANVLETNVHLLPEPLYMDGLLALAGCAAIKDSF